MSTEIFKVGYPLFDIRYGWGRVEISNETIYVEFEKQYKTYHDDEFHFISFTEYDLINGGWSQDRSVLNQPKRGDLVYARDNEDEFWKIGIFHNVSAGSFMISQDFKSKSYPFDFMSVENPLLK